MVEQVPVCAGPGRHRRRCCWTCDMETVESRGPNSPRGELMRLTPSKRVGSGFVPIIAALTLLATPSLSRAQGTVTGQVTAAGTSEPLGDARVMVVNASLMVPTSADGHYTLPNGPTGNIEVRVIRVGYQEQKKPVAVSAGASVTLNFTMTQAVV